MASPERWMLTRLPASALNPFSFASLFYAQFLVSFAQCNTEERGKEGGGMGVPAAGERVEDVGAAV